MLILSILLALVVWWWIRVRGTSKKTQPSGRSWTAQQTVIRREISDPGFVPLSPTSSCTGNGLPRLQAPEGRNSLASGVSHWFGRQDAKAPEGRHTATSVAGNQTVPRTCEPKEHAAYVAPPGLPKYNPRSQWLTPLAKICRRSAATHIEHDAELRNKSRTANASLNRSRLSSPGRSSPRARSGESRRRAEHWSGRICQSGKVKGTPTLAASATWAMARLSPGASGLAEARHGFGRLLRGALISKIPARRPARAGTFDRIKQHLRERLSMYKAGGAMYSIHARAGPWRASFCEKSPRFSGRFCALTTGVGEAPSRCRNRRGALGLRLVPSRRDAKCAFVAVIQT
jgi:hypothetical protein